MKKKHPVSVAFGDGIGPEIMKAALYILEEAGANIDIENVEMGEKIYLQGHPRGIEEKTWESLLRTKVLLKAPIITPQRGGFKSLNVTIRTTLGLYANIRPCISYHPFIKTKHPQMDVVIIRENEEDLYTGIEYQQTPDATHGIKLISRSGSERIIRYAFEYATHFKRKKVTCFTKDNILKMTDGLFHQIFEEIGEEYPHLEKEHWIIDIGAAKLATIPEHFDVIVLPNLYGDILSDVAGQMTGSIGLIGTANIGAKGAMFEAIHGSAPKMANQNIANPSGIILASVLMLLHIHQNDVATLIHNAWLKTIEDGVHTYDIYQDNVSKKKVGTQEFAREIVQRIGQIPQFLKKINYQIQETNPIIKHYGSSVISTKRELVGVDVYLYSHDSISTLLKKCEQINTPSLKLSMIANRGVILWPQGLEETNCTDQWRCRYISDGSLKTQNVAALIHRFADAGLDVIKTENLYLFDGKPGFSQAEI